MAIGENSPGKNKNKIHPQGFWGTGGEQVFFLNKIAI
jgi:hypothetical protein